MRLMAGSGGRPPGRRQRQARRRRRHRACAQDRSPASSHINPRDRPTTRFTLALEHLRRNGAAKLQAERAADLPTSLALLPIALRVSLPPSANADTIRLELITFMQTRIGQPLSTIPSAHQPQPPSQRFAAFTYANRSPASHGNVHGQPLPTLHCTVNRALSGRFFRRLHTFSIASLSKYAIGRLV